MWSFIVLLVFNTFLKGFLDRANQSFNEHLSWIQGEMVKIHKNNNVEQEKIDYVEQSYIPQLQSWIDLIDKKAMWVVIGVQCTIYYALLLTYMDGQSLFFNTLVAIGQATVVVGIVQIMRWVKEAIRMTHNVNELAIESLGNKAAADIKEKTGNLLSVIKSVKADRRKPKIEDKNNEQ